MRAIRGKGNLRCVSYSSSFRIENSTDWTLWRIDFLMNYWIGFCRRTNTQASLLDPTQNLLNHLWISQSWLVAMSSCTVSSSTWPLTRYANKSTTNHQRSNPSTDLTLIFNVFYRDAQVAWIYMERSAILTVQNHVITRNPRISVSHDQHHTWSLHITSVQESDRGGYM